MQYTHLDNIAPAVSRLVYGAAAPTLRSPEEAYDCFEEAFSYGFTMFDTANSYGDSEKNMGYWLARSGRRDKVVIHDKGFNPNQHYGAHVDEFSARTIREQVALSLERLQTDYIDIYTLHRDDPACDPAEIIEELNAQKAAGRILRFGASNWTLERLIRANEYAKAHGLEGFTVFGPAYSLATLANDPWGGSVAASGEKNAPFRKWLSESGMPVIPYSSLARGFMSGRYNTASGIPIEEALPAGTRAEYNVPENIAILKRAEETAAKHGCSVSAVALKWLLSRPMNILPLIAPTGKKHIEEALSALTLELTKAEMEYLKTE